MNPADVDAHFQASVGPVWRELRGKLWHSTTLSRFRLIQDSGEIRPLAQIPEGSRRWGNPDQLFCAARGGVSLFDFEEANWKLLFEQRRESQWVRFLGDDLEGLPVVIVWLALDRGRLPNLLSVERSLIEWQHCLSQKFIPSMETCHIGPIPLQACTHVIAICSAEREEFRRIETPVEIEGLERLGADWRTRFAEAHETRSLSAFENLRRRKMLEVEQAGPMKKNQTPKE